MDILGQTVENNSFATIHALTKEEIPTADSMRLLLVDDIRGKHFSTDSTWQLSYYIRGYHGIPDSEWLSANNNPGSQDCLKITGYGYGSSCIPPTTMR